MAEINAAIAAYGLSKRYEGSKNYALRDLDLKVMPGEIYGFLGPNGAGKTTTFRLLMNFIQPTAGDAYISGMDAAYEATRVKEQAGYMSGEMVLYPKVTGERFLKYMAKLQPPKRQGYAKELARQFQAELTKPIGKLSKGNRQKIGIIQAFMHEPEVLILDEPTSGLDPLMQEVFFELVRTSKKRGATLLISSHNLGEVQRICDRVSFIRKGKLVAEKTITDLAEGRIQTYEIIYRGQSPLPQLKRLRGIKVVSQSSHQITLQVTGDLRTLLTALSRYQVISLERQQISLEDEFLKYYKGGKK